MPQISLSSDDAFNIGQALLDVHDNIRGYLTSHRNSLSPEGRVRLQSLVITYYQNASDVVEHGIGIVIDDALISANGLVSVAKKVQAAVQKIDDEKHIISVAAALVSFAATIPAGGVGAIVQSGKHLIEVTGINADLVKG